VDVLETPKFISKNMKMVSYHDLDGRPGFKLAMQQVGDRWYLYMGHFWHRGWTIMDVTDPYKPELLKFVQGPDNTWTLQVNVADGLMVTALERIFGVPGRDHLWGGDHSKPFAEGVMIWDVRSNPADPKLLHHYKLGDFGTHRNGYFGGKYLYLTAMAPGFHQKFLVILDISDPENPVEVSRWWYPGQHLAGGEKPEYLMYFHGPAYPVGDDLDNPKRLYLPYGRAGMIILDVEDIRNPKMIGRVDIGDFGSVIGVHTVVPLPERNLAIMTTEAILEQERDPLNMVLLVDVSDETKPKPISSFPIPIPPEELGLKDFQDKGGKFGPHNIHMPHFQKCLAPIGNIIHACYESAGLWLYDISNPGVPVPVAYFIPEDPKVRRGPLPHELATQTEDVLVDARGYIYITDKNHGLFILRHEPEE
jgi:hypothetical protein